MGLPIVFALMKTIWQQGLQAAEIKDGAIIHTPTGAEFTRYGEMILRVLHAFHLVLWMVILLAGFSLMAPPNATTFAALFICALSVCGAIFLILELDEPFSGLMSIRSDPLRNALPPLKG